MTSFYLVLKHREDLIERIRNAVHHNDTPSPNYIPAAPPPSNSVTTSFRLYPLIDEFNSFPIYTTGTANTVLFNHTHSAIAESTPAQTVNETPKLNSP